MRCSINRLHIGENGDLIIDHVVPSDEGKYQCVAHNMAATRESPIVSLSVHGECRLRHLISAAAVYPEIYESFTISRH